MSKIHLWPFTIDIQDYFPMETLLEECEFNKSELNEIEFEMLDIIVNQNENGYNTELNTDDGYYRVHFREIEKDIFEFTFRIDREKLKSGMSLSSILQYGKDFKKGTQSTNKRNPIKIFSFVVSSVISFIKKVNPKALYLSANESKKNNSYQLLTRNISKKIGWEVSDGKSNNFYQALIVNPKNYEHTI